MVDALCFTGTQFSATGCNELSDIVKHKDKYKEQYPRLFSAPGTFPTRFDTLSESIERLAAQNGIETLEARQKNAVAEQEQQKSAVAEQARQLTEMMHQQIANDGLEIDGRKM